MPFVWVNRSTLTFGVSQIFFSAGLGAARLEARAQLLSIGSSSRCGSGATEQTPKKITEIEYDPSASASP